MNIALTKILGAIMIIGLRVSGLMVFAPFFSNAVIPPRVKAIFVIAITAVLYPVYSLAASDSGSFKMANDRWHGNGSGAGHRRCRLTWCSRPCRLPARCSAFRWAIRWSTFWTRILRSKARSLRSFIRAWRC